MNKLFIFPLVISLALFFCWSMPYVQAEENKKKLDMETKIDNYKVIRLHSYGGVSPKAVTVKPGTVVIWVNDSRSLIGIQFKGKQVTLACKSPVHFVVDETGSYIADQIPQDAVASLCFLEKGEFKYVTRGSYSETGGANVDKIKEYTGKIVVE